MSASNNSLAQRMIAHDGRHSIEIRKSRFICSLARVSGETEARSFVEERRTEFWDATHNCVAWIIGEGGRLQRSNDDGEPSGTSGKPMLEVLRRRELTETIAVVTRYFGGTLIGAGGLIRAYSQVVNETIDAIGIVERILLQRVDIHISHIDAGRFEHAIRSSPFPPDDVSYDGNGATFSLAIEPAQVMSLHDWAAEASNGAAEVVLTTTAFRERVLRD